MDVLRFLLTETAKITKSYNLLHIACRLKENPSIKKKRFSDIDLIRTIIKYDKFADLNT